MAEYNKDLEEWLCSDMSGHFQTLVRSLLSAEREETVEIDFEMAEMDAQKLFDVSGTFYIYLFLHKNFIYKSMRKKKHQVRRLKKFLKLF